MPDIHPTERFIVVKGEKCEFPSRITEEFQTHIRCAFGTFLRATRKMVIDPRYSFVGPFGADGRLE